MNKQPGQVPAVLMATFAVLLSACSGGRAAAQFKLLPDTSSGRPQPDLSTIGRVTSLVADGDRFYVGGQAGVAAVGQDGTVLWMKPQPPALLRLVSASGGKVAASSFEVVGLDPATNFDAFALGRVQVTDVASAQVAMFSPAGEALWSTTLPKPADWVSPPTIHDRAVGVQTSFNFYLLDLATGAVTFTVAVNNTRDFTEDKMRARHGRIQPVRVGDNFMLGWANVAVVVGQDGVEHARKKLFAAFLYAGGTEANGRALFGYAGHDSAGVFEMTEQAEFVRRRAAFYNDCFDIAAIGTGFLARCGDTLSRVGAKGEPSWNVKKLVGPSAFAKPVSEEGAENSGTFAGAGTGKYVVYKWARSLLSMPDLVAKAGRVYVATREGTQERVTVLDDKKGAYLGSIAADANIVGIAATDKALAIATARGMKVVDLQP